MSDLHCPARVFVARHGEAEYAVAGVLTDDDGWLTERGERQAAQLAAELRDERLAAVYTSPLARAVRTGQIVAETLALPVRSLPGLREFRIGDLAGQPPEAADAFMSTWLRGDPDALIPGGESGTVLFDRVRAALDEIADAHRGEAVLVVTHGGAMSYCLPRLAANGGPLRAAPPPLANCAVVAMEQDGDGWRLVRPWQGSS